MGIDLYAVQGAFGLVVVALALLAAIWPAVGADVGASVGIAAVYLGIISFKWHPTPGGFDRTWSILCMAWGSPSWSVPSSLVSAAKPSNE